MFIYKYFRNNFSSYIVGEAALRIFYVYRKKYVIVNVSVQYLYFKTQYLETWKCRKTSIYIQ